MFIPIWILISLLSALTYSFREILSKSILKKYDTSGTQIMFEENLVIISVILLIFFPFVQFQLFYNLFIFFFFKATLFAIASLLFFSLLKKYEISIVSPMMNLSPFFLLILSSLFLSESVTLLQVLGIIIIIISTLTLEHINKTHHKNKHKTHSIKELLHSVFSHIKEGNWHFIFSVVGVLLFLSTATILDKVLFNNSVNIISNMYFTGLLLFIYMVIYLSYTKKLVPSCKNIVKQPQTLLIGVVSLLDRGLVFTAIANPNALVSLIIPLRRTSTIYSSLIGGILFHEKNLKKKLCIVCIMILGVLLISL